MNMSGRLCALILVICLLAGMMYIPAFSVADETEFKITDVYARTAADGSLVKDGFLSASSGLCRNTSAFSDKPAYPIVELPDHFLGCGIILANYKAVTATQNTDLSDCLTFDINKSSTVYVVNWGGNEPSWASDGWKASDGSGFKALNPDSGGIMSARFIYEKHFDVTEEKTTVSIGGVRGSVRYYTVVVRPDELKQPAKYPFSEEELKNEKLEKEVMKDFGDGIALFKNINYGFVNGRKTPIDASGEVAPVISNGTTYVPLRFLVESLKGKVSYNEKTNCAQFSLQNKNYSLDLSKNLLTNITDGKEIKVSKLMAEGRTLVPLRVISENCGYFVFWKDGLILIGQNEREFSDSLLSRISSLFVIPLDALALKLKCSKPGDTIYIKEGTYNNISLFLEAKGEEGKPITIKANDPSKTQFKGSAKVVLRGEYITFDGFYFNEITLRETPMIALSGGVEHSRITNCYFYKCRTSSVSGSLIDMTNHSAYNRVDHNVFEAAESLGVSIGGVYAPSGNNSKVYHNKIDHNYFKDFKAAGEVWSASNGMEPIRIGGTGMFDLHTIAEYNIFENIIADGAEIISNKSNYSTIRYNTFINNYSSGVCLRGGNNADVYGNYFINGRSGIRIYDHSQEIFDNYFYNIYRDSIRISTTDNNSYAHLKDILVANNTVVNPGWGGIIIGDKLNNLPAYVLPPDNIRVINNHVVAMKGHALRYAFINNYEYKNNIISAYGNGSNEEAKLLPGENNSFENTELIFDGIYRPKDMNVVSKKGMYVENINTHTGRETFDIGVNDINGEGRKGLLTANDVGPVDKWWIPHLRKPAADYRDIEPAKTPVSYVSAVNNIAISKDGNYDIMNLGGYATYEDGKSYTINPELVSYKILSGEDVVYISGNNIKAYKSGMAQIEASYRGKSALINIRAYEGDEYVSYGGSWEVGENILSEQTTNTKTIINKGRYVDSDFSLSFKYTAKEGNSDAYVFLGDKGYKIDNSIPLTSEYAIDDTRYIVCFGTNESTAGIYRYDGWNTLKLATMLVPNDDGKEHQAEITYYDNKLVVKSDGKTVSVAELTDKIEGNIGFGAYTSRVEFKDIVLSKENITTEEKNVGSLTLNTEVPVYENLTVKTDKLSEKGVIYKLYVNGVFAKDSYEPLFEDNKIDVYDEYKYLLKAFDENGVVIAEGSLNYNGSREPEGEFYINNLNAKIGLNETYINCDYLQGNSVPAVIQRGLSDASTIFSDRTYKYVNVPEEFLGAAYILNNYQIRADSYFKQDSLTDFLKFDVHNKSVTIYIAVFSTTVPGWLIDQQWNVTRYPIGFWQNTTTIKKADYVYRKHFDVKPGETRTITLGGIGSSASFAYGVIIVPDK